LSAGDTITSVVRTKSLQSVEQYYTFISVHESLIEQCGCK